MISRWQNSDMQAFLYRKYISEREPGTPEIKEIAGLLKDTEYGEKYGYSWSLVYKYFRGEETPPPEFFPSLYNVTDDRDIPNWYIDRCGNLKIIVIPDPGELNGTIADEIIQAGSEHGTLCEVWLKSISDGTIDREEASRLLMAIQEQENTLNLMREEIKRMAEDSKWKV